MVIEKHRSILTKELMGLMNIETAERVCDATFGDGGHSEYIIEHAPNLKKLFAIDQDAATLKEYQACGIFRKDPRLIFFCSLFSNVNTLPIKPIDACIVDLGVSSRQLLDPLRGFSFNHPGPLDMRMDSGAFGKPILKDILFSISEKKLAEHFSLFMPFAKSHKVAKVLLTEFHHGNITNTKELANCVAPFFFSKKNRATLPFLALRTLVNDECGEIQKGIPELISTLRKGGRMGILTFHSTEDRLVKNILQTFQSKNIIVWINKKVIKPTYEEIRKNPRSRSAHLRCIEKIID